MQTIENLKELIKKKLFENEGELKLREHKDIAAYAKDIGLDDRKLSKLIQEVDASINWEYIKQQNTSLAFKKNREPQANSVTTNPNYAPDIKVENNVKLKDKPQKKLVTIKRVLIAGCLALIYLAILKSEIKNREKGTTMFCYVEALEFRNSPETASVENITSRLFYGDSVLVLSTDSGWAYCLLGNQKGYVSTGFLMNRQDFYEMDCIFVSEEARKTIKFSYWRKALLQYFKSRAIIGNLKADKQHEIYGNYTDRPMWGFDILPFSKHNTFLIPKESFSVSNYYPIGIIIRNLTNNDRRFLLFDFEINGDPILLDESPAPTSGNIKTIYKTRKGSYKVQYTY